MKNKKEKYQVMLYNKENHEWTTLISTIGMTEREADAFVRGFRFGRYEGSECEKVLVFGSHQPEAVKK